MIFMIFMPCSSTIQIWKEENITRIVWSFIISHNPDKHIATVLNINILLNKQNISFSKQYGKMGKY